MKNRYLSLSKKSKFSIILLGLFILTATVFAGNAVVKHRTKRVIKVKATQESVMQTTNSSGGFIGSQVPSSPNVAALEKFVNFPVSNFTGVPNISVPIHTVTEGNLSLPISVDYNASGIKVEETASWVGLGWALNAGGSISRQVMGGPDEGRSQNGCYNYSGWYKDYGSVITKPYILDNPVLIGNNCDETFTSNLPGCNNGSGCVCYDPNLEYSIGSPICPQANFNYYYAARGCVDTEPDVFYFNVAGYSGRFYFDGNRTAHIVPEQDVIIEPNFSITNGKGNFDSWVMITPDGTKYHFGGSNATETQQTYNDANGETGHLLNSSWQLTKIESADGIHEINLTYVTENYTAVNLSGQSAFVSAHHGCIPISRGPAGLTLNQYGVSNFTYTATVGKRLSQISAPTSQVNFIASSNSRQDIPVGNHVYNAPTTGGALSLSSINISIGNNCKKFEFQTSYFNSDPSTGLSTAHQTDLVRLKLDAIQEKTCNNTIQKPPYIFTYNSTDLPRRFSLAQDHWGYYNGKYNNTTLIPPLTVPDMTGNTTYCGTADRGVDENFTEAGILEQVTYPTGASRTIEYEVHSVYNEQIGGLRTKKVITNDGLGNLSETNYTYTLGQLYIDPRDKYIVNVNDGINQVKNLINNMCQLNSIAQYLQSTYLQDIFTYYIVSSSSLIPEEAAMGSHIGYGKVTVKNSGNNGESAYLYNLRPYFDVNNYNIIKYPTAPAPILSGRGTLQAEIQFNENGQKVSETINSYTTEVIGSLTGKRVATLNAYRYGSNTFAELGIQVYHDYSLNLERHRLSQRVTRQDGITTTIDYTYGSNHNNPIETKTTNSDGTIHISKTKYSKDYDCSNVTSDVNALAIKEMQERNIIIPIEQTSLIDDGSRKVLGSSFTKFEVDAASNAIIPKDFYRLETTAPISEYQYSYMNIHSNGNLGYDARFVHKATVNEYDNKANIQEFARVGGEPMSFIWGHNQQLPTAKVINTESNQVGYSSFEVESELRKENGNIFIFKSSSLPAVNSTDAKTGLKSVLMQQGGSSGLYKKLRFDVNVNDTYILSFWYKNGRVKTQLNNTVQNTTPIETEWTYKELEITAVDGQYIELQTLNGETVLIDEVRIYPKGALMSTFSYDDDRRQLVSITDENNVSAHFQYDDFQRLEAVKDQDGNIVQAYDYEYHNGNSINKVESYTVLKAGQTTLNTVKALNTGTGDVSKAIQYMDGLGRGIQSVAVAQTPNGKDMVQHIEYDEYGRSPKAFLPYNAITNNGAYQPNADLAQRAVRGNYGFSESKYDGSPLNRVIEQAAPGQAWRMNGGVTSQQSYRANTTTDNVRDFSNNTYFAANELMVTEVIGEDGILTRSYSDKLGRSILSERELDNGSFAKTYNVYDDFGNLVTVIPPKAVQALGTGWNMSTIHELVYEYRYDSRGHLIEKKIPGAAPIIMVYDILDRLILTQDGNQRNAGKWSFTKYDELSRPIQSGLAAVSGLNITLKTNTASNANTTRNTITPVANNLIPSGYNLYEVPTNTTISYTNNAFPSATTADVLSVTYYDDYDFDNDGTEDYSFTNRLGLGNDKWFKRTKGKLIGTKVKVLDNNNTWLHTVTFYDEYGRVIQVKGEHHLNGEDLTTTKYDFSGKVLETERKHTKAAQADILINNYFNYDHVGRVLSHDISIDEAGGLKPTKFRLSENEYNELSQLIEKKLHARNEQTFLQNIDYQYNIRGWLTDINDIEFGAITAVELQEQVVEGLVSQVNNGIVEVELNAAELENGNRETITVEEGGAEEEIELEEDVAPSLTAVLTDAINIGDIGMIDESNIDQALETMRTQLETQLTNLGVTDETSRGMVEDEVLAIYQGLWLRTVANDDDNDLFAMHFDYTESNALINATGQYNGNISAATWRVRGKNKKAYKYEYDNLNRLTSADYMEIDDNNQVVTSTFGGYDMSADYDLNGNITSMYRKGATVIDAAGQGTAFGVIDNMTYTYANNQIQKIYETAISGSNTALLNSKGFKDNGINVVDYTYDDNGNITHDANKDVTITYNHLNLPTKFEWSVNQYIEITYDAAGVKLTKTKNNNGTITTKHYIGGIEYNGNDLEAVHHAEGRATYEANSTTSTQGAINGFRYEYSIKDHLGNARVMFSDMNGNGQVTETEIIQVEHYYPFGMSQEGHGHAIISETFYTYNGKELNDDFGLGLHDYGARWYDAAVGRWQGVDNLAEAYIKNSPYHYSNNNPIFYIDVDGNRFTPAGQAWANDLRNTTEGKINNNNNKMTQLLEEFGDMVGSAQEVDEDFLNKTGGILEEFNNLSEENEDLNVVLDEICNLEESSQVYNVVVNPGFFQGAYANADGAATFNSDNGQVDLILRDNNGLELFAHELKHAHQFETGTISLTMHDGAYNMLAAKHYLAYDKTDEREAYKRQGLFGLTHDELPDIYDPVPNNAKSVLNDKTVNALFNQAMKAPNANTQRVYYEELHKLSQRVGMAFRIQNQTYGQN